MKRITMVYLTWVEQRHRRKTCNVHCLAGPRTMLWVRTWLVLSILNLFNDWLFYLQDLSFVDHLEPAIRHPALNPKSAYSIVMVTKFNIGHDIILHKHVWTYEPIASRRQMGHVTGYISQSGSGCNQGGNKSGSYCSVTAGFNWWQVNGVMPP